MPANRTLTRATAYIDSQDLRKSGWAYKLDFGDGHEESGALEANNGDDASYELEALVIANSGVSSPSIVQNDRGYAWAAEPSTFSIVDDEGTFIIGGLTEDDLAAAAAARQEADRRGESVWLVGPGLPEDGERFDPSIESLFETFAGKARDAIYEHAAVRDAWSRVRVHDDSVTVAVTWTWLDNSTDHNEDGMTLCEHAVWTQCPPGWVVYDSGPEDATGNDRGNGQYVVYERDSEE